MTFDGKSKSTSQFFFNLKEDSETKTSEKLQHAIDDYFEYYSDFQNKEIIKEVEAYSLDFRCSNKCAITSSNKLSVVNLVFHAKTLAMCIEASSKKFDIEVHPRLLQR